ncbi:MAG: hypothetical protein K0R93_3647 [Anaerosolibacter sp.]|uniref:peptidoglycan-binding domain-containing protein n=1 Tax=Anaerosolibacter sp. TaxID=1872527 RepID=UPI0026238107|nr:peptidoglycan-binding domain-containing protein [Anaerosolibacter sp.]MDF2548749.1 hypothetical protein [Anaerosolibacter sp.]
MKKAIALAVCASFMFSSVALAADSVTLKQGNVDVVAAATAWTPAPAPAPKPAPAPAPKPAAPKVQTPVAAPVKADGTLQLGSKGTAVKDLQTKLNANGYKLTTDGIFGKLTLAAVKDYQTKNGLTADGIVGAAMMEKLNAPAATPKVDVVSAATKTMVTDEVALLKGISKDGSWIVLFEKDFTTDKELVLDGEFKNKEKLDRKLALYTQDADKKVTGSFTLTAPKLTVKSPATRIQNGTFKGDLYVSAPNLQLRGAKIVGNVYFTTQEAKDTFTMDAKSSITGEKVLIQPDVVTTASLVDSAAAFEKGISKDGTWIVSLVRDLKINKTLLLEGEFTNKDLPARKIALYSQDEKRATTRKFTLEALTLTIKSPNASIQKGTFKGDLYVAVPNFKLVDARIEGDVYFTTKEAQETFSADATSVITGKQELIAVDTVSSATEVVVTNEEELTKAVGQEGAWIVIFTEDVATDKELVLDGYFTNDEKPQRKVALYSQDDKRNVTARFTLTAPKLTIKSPMASLQKGTFKGDIYVRAKNFKLVDTKVEGDVYFTTQEAKDTFTMDATSSITGKQILADVDVVATASLVHDGVAFEKAIAKDGTWIICPLRDLTIDKDLVVEGEFRDKNLPENDFKRKVGLYTHNDPTDKKKATHSFTLTAPSITFRSPKSTLQYGTFVGDIYVESNNFSLVRNTVKGNIYFATQEAMDTFTMDEFSSVSGVKVVKQK